MLFNRHEDFGPSICTETDNMIPTLHEGYVRARAGYSSKTNLFPSRRRHDTSGGMRVRLAGIVRPTSPGIKTAQ